MMWLIAVEKVKNIDKNIYIFPIKCCRSEGKNAQTRQIKIKALRRSRESCKIKDKRSAALHPLWLFFTSSCIVDPVRWNFRAAVRRPRRRRRRDRLRRRRRPGRYISREPCLWGKSCSRGTWPGSSGPRGRLYGLRCTCGAPPARRKTLSSVVICNTRGARYIDTHTLYCHYASACSTWLFISAPSTFIKMNFKLAARKADVFIDFRFSLDFLWRRCRSSCRIKHFIYIYILFSLEFSFFNV